VIFLTLGNHHKTGLIGHHRHRQQKSARHHQGRPDQALRRWALLALSQAIANNDPMPAHQYFPDGAPKPLSAGQRDSVQWR
jgi:hypothetical protein